MDIINSLRFKFKSNEKYTLSFYTEKSEKFNAQIEETDYGFIIIIYDEYQRYEYDA